MLRRIIDERNVQTTDWDVFPVPPIPDMDELGGSWRGSPHSRAGSKRRMDSSPEDEETRKRRQVHEKSRLAESDADEDVIHCAPTALVLYDGGALASYDLGGTANRGVTPSSRRTTSRRARLI